MKKIKFVLSLLSISLIMIIVACGGADKNDSNDKTNEEENTEVIVDVEIQQTVDDTEYSYIDEGDKVGLTDEEGNVIIPAEFDFIAYPGDTYLGIAEVSKNGKFGLYSVPGGLEIVPPEYDVFYPVADKNILAYYKKENIYGIMKKKNATSGDYSKYSKSPFANGTVAEWKFSFPTKTFTKNDEGYYYLPSFIKNFHTDLIISGGEIDNQVMSFNLSVIGNINQNNENYYFLKNIIDYGGYATDVELIICGTDIYQKFYTAPLDNYAEINDVTGTFEFKILDANIFRVKNSNDGSNLNSKNKNYPATSLDYYFYYQITENKVENLKSNRYFAFTKYEKITPEFFEGFFLGEQTFSDESGPQVSVTKHLSIEDLDVMRNEIFAEYGYSFKTEKWKNFFGELDWYKPEAKNVDAQLNEIEKENIKIILKEKAKMLNNEEKYLQTFTTSVSMAG